MSLAQQVINKFLKLKRVTTPLPPFLRGIALTYCKIDVKSLLAE